MASSAPASGVDVAIPDWRVFILRPDDTVAGEGILISHQRILTSGNALRDALLGGRPRPQLELKLRFGANGVVAIRSQLSEMVTTESVWTVSLPSATDHEPARIATTTAGDRVLVANGSLVTELVPTPPVWIPATVDRERADGTIELSMERVAPAPNGFGAVINGAGHLVGVTRDALSTRMIPAANLAGLEYPSTEDPTPTPPELATDPSDTDTDPTPGGSIPAPGRYRHPEPRIARDCPTTEDALSYRRYVDAIATFLRHRDTRPPLSIAVTGSWGSGKTSLMRMVQEELDPGAGRDDPCEIRFDDESRATLRRTGGGRDAVSNREVVRTASQSARHEPLRAVVADQAPIEGGEWRPTVWFNPWMYQNGDQVWAGLAYAIIGQVADRLPAGDRERFWLRINLGRTDRERVRRGFYRLLFGRLVPLLVFWLVVVVLAGGAMLVATVLPYASDAVQAVGRYLGLGGTLAALAGAAARFVASARDSAATGPFTTLLKQPPMLPKLQEDLAASPFDAAVPDPGYGGRLGFLHLVQSDMRRVLKLVATEDRPLVVFVDDLDRCSPGTVAQVIEALNLFLAGEFPNCVFVLAMEPAAVAAHVESAYHDLAATFAADQQDNGSSLGWRFLDKMIQLPLRLPDPDTSSYLDRLLGNEPAPDAPSEPSPSSAKKARYPTVPDVTPPVHSPGTGPTAAEVRDDTPEPDAEAARRRRIDTVERLAAEIRQRLGSAAGIRDAAIAAQRAVLERGEPLAPETLEAAERVFAGLYSDQDAAVPLRAALPCLGRANPRELKRYLNLFRFYTFIAERERLRGAPAPDSAAVAKLAAFVIRWPHLLPAGRTDWSARLARLEAVARDDPDRWTPTVGAIYPDLPAGAAATLREFLAGGPAVGAEAFRLL